MSILLHAVNSTVDPLTLPESHWDRMIYHGVLLPAEVYIPRDSDITYFHTRYGDPMAPGFHVSGVVAHALAMTTLGLFKTLNEGSHLGRKWMARIDHDLMAAGTLELFHDFCKASKGFSTR